MFDLSYLIAFSGFSGARIYFAALSTSSPQDSHQQPTGQFNKGPSLRGRPFIKLARGLGFEPRLEVPKTPVLPLDDPRTVYKVRVELPL